MTPAARYRAARERAAAEYDMDIEAAKGAAAAIRTAETAYTLAMSAAQDALGDPGEEP